MNKLILTLLLLSGNALAVEVELKPIGWYPDKVSPTKGKLFISVLKKDESKFYELDLDKIQIRDSSKVDYEKKINSEKKSNIKYILNNCLSVDEIYHSYDSLCKSATFIVGEKEYQFTEDKFFKWEKFIDPVKWGDYLIFKNYSSANKSVDTDKLVKPTIFGISIFDLRNKKRIIDPYLHNFGSSFVTFLKIDNDNSFLWVGSNYGLYAFNEKMDEKISCIFFHDKKSLLGIICQQADYVNSLKHDQAQLLLEKYNALKNGKKAPRDMDKEYYEKRKEFLEKRK